MRSWRVKLPVTHVMFPVSDSQIYGLISSVFFHLMTSNNKYFSSVSGFKVSKLKAKRRLLIKMCVHTSGENR